MTHVIKGDLVRILSGKDRGKEGKVLSVELKAGRAVVEGRNILTRHERPKRAGSKGQKVQFPKALPLSRLILVCPHCKKPARTGHLEDEKGVKSRVCRKCRKRI